MECAASCGKNGRILDFFVKLKAGEAINKVTEAERYNVSERSIQRDIDDLRAFFSDKEHQGESKCELRYDRKQKGYILHQENSNYLSNGEILSICKVLLESRAFNRTELSQMLDKLVTGCAAKENLRAINALLANEKHLYIPVKHEKNLTEDIWRLGVAVLEHLVILLRYKRMGSEVLVERTVKPVGIMFSEFYFYLTAYIENQHEWQGTPTIYRIDRIESFKVLDKHFEIPYKNRFQEGEFRKRVQFMYGGKLKRVNFKFTGQSVEAVLDRLPTAEIIDSKDGVYTISAEVFGDGIEMWLRSQGDKVRKIIAVNDNEVQ